MMDKLIFHDVVELVVWKEIYTNFKTRITAKRKGDETIYTVTIL